MNLIKLLAAGLVAVLLLILLLLFYWDSEPDSFDVLQHSRNENRGSADFVTGYVTTATMIRVIETLMEKRGGYLSNDVMPPGVFMDNIPAWEFGVLTRRAIWRVHYAMISAVRRHNPLKTLT